MKNIVIIGGNSFIAQNLIKEFNDKSKYFIDVFVRNKIDNNISNQENIKYHVSDYYINLISILNVFKNKNIDNIYYFTCSLNPRDFSRKNLIDNFLNDINLLAEILKLNRQYTIRNFTYFSTAGAIYGENNTERLNEKSICAPDTLYGNLKLISEKLINTELKNSKTNFLILRPTNVYGPFHNSNEVGIINIFFRKLINESKIDIYGDGNQIRNFIFVKDLTKITKILFENNVNNEIINISSDFNFSVLNIYNLINSIVKNNFKITKFENIDCIKLFSNDLLISKLNNFTFTNFIDSLNETYNYEINRAKNENRNLLD